MNLYEPITETVIPTPGMYRKTADRRWGGQVLNHEGSLKIWADPNSGWCCKFSHQHGSDSLLGFTGLYRNPLTGKITIARDIDYELVEIYETSSH